MILPTSQLYVLILLVVSMVCCALWPSLFKSATRWRFELFQYDLAWGFALAAVVAAFTLGMWNSKELTFQDNFLLTGYRNIGWAIGAGIALCFASITLMGGVTISGMSVAYPLAFGVAWAMLAVWDFMANTQISALLTFSGAAAVVVSGILAMIAQLWYLQTIANEAAAMLHADPRLKPAKQTAPNQAIGFVLSILSGLAIGGFFRCTYESGFGENGMSSYSVVLMAALGFVAGAAGIVPFFLYFPVKGAPLQVRHYFRGTPKHHVLGVLGGMLLAVAVLAGLVATSVPVAQQIAPIERYLMGRSAPIAAVVLGLMVWKEFSEAATRVKAMVAASVVLMALGMSIIAFAPFYGK
ncbi:MAG: hypothetical protein ABI824_04345 [Acidobacteriota bacterium]